MKILYMIFGCTTSIIGLIGIFLPVLPVTPFLLISLFCFKRSSDKFHKIFVNSKIYKKHLKNFDENRAMTLKTKIKILALATSMILISVVLAPIIYVKIFLFLMTVYLYYYFFNKIETIPSVSIK